MKPAHKLSYDSLICEIDFLVPIPLTLQIYGRKHPYIAGDREQPDEPETYFVERVMLGDKDVLCELTDCQLDKITDYCNEVA